MLKSRLGGGHLSLPRAGGQGLGPGRAERRRRCRSGGPGAADGAVSPRNSARRPPPSSARPPPRQILKCRLYGRITARGTAAVLLTKAGGSGGWFFPRLLPPSFSTPYPAGRAPSGWHLLAGHAQCTRGESKAWSAPRTRWAFIILKIQRHFLLCDRDG